MYIGDKNVFVRGNMVFINIDNNYLKALHDVCEEVCYKSSGYESKPFLVYLLIKAIEDMLFHYHLPNKSIRNGKMLIKNYI